MVISRIVLLSSITAILISGCAAMQGGGASPAPPPASYQNVTAMQMSNPGMAKPFAGKGVRFDAKFASISSGWGIGGFEAYHQTHTMASFTDESGGTLLPYVVILSTDPVLATLKRGDLVTIEAVPEDKDVIVGIIVQHLTKK